MAKEYFDVLNESGEKTGYTKLRQLVHRDGDWHRAVNVWVVNGGVLLQRRALDKDSYPGLWDISCGGHLIAGDDSLTGAIRELKEELGIDVAAEDLEYLLTWKSSTRPAPGFINNSFNDLYLLHGEYPLEAFTMQSEEISELKYFPIHELHSLIVANNSAFVPHPEAYAKLFDLFLDNN